MCVRFNEFHFVLFMFVDTLYVFCSSVALRVEFLFKRFNVMFHWDTPFDTHYVNVLEIQTLTSD